MREVVRAQVGTHLNDDEVESVVKAIFEEADIDGDEKLSFVEFDHVMARCPDFVKCVPCTAPWRWWNRVSSLVRTVRRRIARSRSASK